MSHKQDSDDVLEQSIATEDILGKDVIDPEGTFLGIVENIRIDPETVEIIGIAVDKGFLKKGLIIGKEYLERITPYAIFISIRPLYNIKGMYVFDQEGRSYGKVTEVELASHRNELKGIYIKQSLKGDAEFIEATQIDHIGDNVILTK